MGQHQPSADPHAVDRRVHLLSRAAELLGPDIGWLGEASTEELAVILAMLAIPLAPILALLPLLGVMLNGTSSVLYCAMTRPISRASSWALTRWPMGIITAAGV